MTEEEQYTEEDLRCAMYALQVENDVAVEQSAPPHREFKSDAEKVGFFEASMTVLALEDREDRAYFDREVVPPGVERYRLGKQVLKTCKVLVSYRSTCLGDNEYDAMVEGETVVSPVMRIDAGYIATSEAQRYVALALRKTPAKSE